MIKKKKRRIITIGFITIIVLIAVFITYLIIRKNNKKPSELGKTEQYFTVLEDGTKVNNSPKIKENKQFDELDITNIELREKGEITQLIATVTNNTNSVKGGYPANMVFVDENNNELAQMGIYIKELQPGETTTLNASITFNYTNAYDIIIKK